MTPLIIKDQFGIIQNLHMSPIPQTSFLVGTFFATSYNKTALEVLFQPVIYKVVTFLYFETTCLVFLYIQLIHSHK